MKQIEEKLKRTVKYWRISYQQASGRDRLYVGLFSLLVLRLRMVDYGGL